MRKVLLAISLASVVAAVMPSRPVRAAGQTAPAHIDPNALADALMAFFGADVSDDTNLTDDSAGDLDDARDKLTDECCLAMWRQSHPTKEEEPKVQSEDVVPIDGGSSPPPDEVMDDAPGFRLVSFSAPSGAAPTLTRPFAVYSGLHGGVMQMRIFSPRALSTAEWRRIAATRGVLSPISDAAKRRVGQRLRAMAAPGSGVHVTTVPLRGYCVEPVKLPPGADAMFAVAPAAAQEQFRPMRAVRRAAEFAAARGYLRPQGDPNAYGQFITQYAIWTKLEHWDQARFTEEFVKRSRLAAKDGNRPSTGDSEQTLRALAPGRWRDVQLVISAANSVEGRMRTRPASSGGVQ